MSLTQHFPVIPHKRTGVQTQHVSLVRAVPDPSLSLLTSLTLPITSLPKPGASPRTQDKPRRNRRSWKAPASSLHRSHPAQPNGHPELP